MYNKHFQINLLCRGLLGSISLLGENLRVCVFKVFHLNLNCDFADEDTQGNRY